MWVESSSSSSSLSDFGISISHQVFQWFNEIWSWCIRKLKQSSQRGWSSLSRNSGKALKLLSECLESNLDRPGILGHFYFQFLITSNKIFQILLVWGEFFSSCSYYILIAGEQGPYLASSLSGAFFPLPFATVKQGSYYSWHTISYLLPFGCS